MFENKVNENERTGRNDLVAMVDKKILQKIGKTQAAYYVIRQTFGKKGDRKIIKSLRKIIFNNSQIKSIGISVLLIESWLLGI